MRWYCLMGYYHRNRGLERILMSAPAKTRVNWECRVAFSYYVRDTPIPGYRPTVPSQSLSSRAALIILHSK